MSQHNELVEALKTLVDRDYTYLNGFVMGDQIRCQDIMRARRVLAKSEPDSANASLIAAAAPEMLDALKMCLVRTDNADHLLSLEKKIIAAIAKATGGES